MTSPAPTSRRAALSLAATLALSLAALLPAGAQTYNWTPTAVANDYNWNVPSNWDTGVDFPNAEGAVANVNNDILGNQTIRLMQGITIGTLNLGDANGSNTFTISSGPGTNPLTFESATAGGGTLINLLNEGTVTSTIATGIVLGGTSDLTVNTLTQGLNLNGGINFNGNSLILNAAGTMSMTGAMTGTGNLIKNGSGQLSVGSDNTFVGNFFINNGTLLVSPSNGRLSAFNELNISNRGVVQLGTGSTYGTNPTPATSRLNPAGTVNMEAGRIIFGGVFQGDTITQESAPTINFRSGTATVDLTAVRTTTGDPRPRQHELTFTDLTREAGATAQFRMTTSAGTAGDPAGGNRYLVTGPLNLIGGGGAADSTTASIIPWAISGTNTFNQVNQLLTYGANGLQIVTTYQDNINAATQFENVSTNTATLTASKEVNALRVTSTNNTLNLGGNTLSVGSGAVVLADGGTSITEGTLNFGAREGIIYSLATNDNTVSANITGTGGLTKAGTGNLILSGINTVTGDIHIGGGSVTMGVENGFTGGNTVILADTTVNSLNGNVPTTTTWNLNSFNQTVGALAGGGANGGNVTLGTANLSVGRASGTTTYSGVISGDGSFTKTGGSTQVLAGVNTYTGATQVSGGVLIVNGSLSDSSSVTVEDGAILGGSGKVGNISGAGTIAAGNSPGILEALSIDPSAGMDFDIELTLQGAPDWSDATASGNDVLRLTAATPITATMDADNVFNIYFATAGTYQGGIFTDTDADFSALVENATFNFYVGGVLIDPSLATWDIVQVASADFAGGTVTGGWTMEFSTAVPEPTSALLAGIAGVVFMLRRRRR